MLQAASHLPEKLVGEKEDISTGTTQPVTQEGKTMHAIVWRGNYDVRYVYVLDVVIICASVRTGD